MAFQVLGDTVIDQNQIITSPKLILEGTSASDSILSGSLNGDSKLEIKADGSASFAGDLSTGIFSPGSTTTTGTSVLASGQINVQQASGSNGYFTRGFQGNAETYYVKSDGSATFAGNVSVGSLSPDFFCQVTRPGGAQVTLGGSDDYALWTKDSKAIIKYDGSATFDGVLTGNQRVVINGAGGKTGSAHTLLNYAGDGSTVTASFTADGGAAFAGTVAVGGLTVGGSSVDTSSQVDSKISAAINAIPATDLSNYDTSTEVTNKINTILGGAPAALNTLNELAAAIGDDANFASTITGQLSNKVDSSTLSSTLSSYPKIDGTNNVITSPFNITYNSGITGSSQPGYSHAAIEIQTSGNHVPAISFHRGGYSAVTLYENGSQLRIKPNSTNSQEGLILSTGNIGSYAWTSSNDGSGSGLDADKLDGQEGSYYRNASNINAGTFPDRFSNTTRYNIGYIDGNGSSSYDKIRVWDSSSYTIGMHSGQTFGWLNDYAMTFTMNNESDRGFLWRDTSDSSAQGAMSLTTNGNLGVGNAIAVGGQTSRYLREPTGQYGSIQISGGGYGGWEGLSIDGRAVFMHNGDAATGIYNDVNNHWLFYAIHNGSSYMYHAGNECIKTVSSTDATIGGDYIVRTAGAGLSKSGSTINIDFSSLSSI